MTPLQLDPGVLDDLRAVLPGVAQRTVDTLVSDVPEYADAFSGDGGSTIQAAVQAALAGFLHLAGQAGELSPVEPAREGAYALGRGEARSGRTMDALLAAYRLGARVAWREWSATAVTHGVQAETIAQFAELVFAYIDELSAASVAGHTDQLATSGRVRSQYLERLGTALLTGSPPEALEAAALRADWLPPEVLSVVLLPSARTRDTLPVVDPLTLVVPGDLVGLADVDVLLVPGARRQVLRVLAGRPAVVGPTRPWGKAAASFARASRMADLIATEGTLDANGAVGGSGVVDGLVDTETNLTSLVLLSDPAALADLRAQVLAPLADLRPATAARLAETLRAWLLHQGRREDAAAALHVHAQTVRYRMNQVRELFGDQLNDPEVVLRLTVALALDPVTTRR